MSKIILLDIRNNEREIKDKKIIFISKISNDGKTIIPLDSTPIIFEEKETFWIMPLSIRYQIYIATDRMNTYIVSLVANKK